MGQTFRQEINLQHMFILRIKSFILIIIPFSKNKQTNQKGGGDTEGLKPLFWTFTGCLCSHLLAEMTNKLEFQLYKVELALSSNAI